MHPLGNRWTATLARRFAPVTLYAINFLMSQDGQTRTTRWGRAPVRRDVTPIPPDLFARLDKHKIVPVTPTTEEDRRNRRVFDEIFRGR